MAVRVGSIEIEKLTRVSVRERARVLRHDVPGLEGDLSQTLGRSSVEVVLDGIFYGASALDKLGELRALHLAYEPVDFFADAIGEGYFTQVLIARLDLTQRAGELDQYNFTCEVIEYVEPPEPAVADMMPALDTGLLDEAAGFMDDVQNALEQVSQLADLVANAPSFGDPTSRLPQMTGDFTSAVADTPDTLRGLNELL
jgi:hypothetical protein